MVRKNQGYKCETPFQGPYEIVQMWTKRNVTIQMGAVTSRINIRRKKPYRNLNLD